jgi:SAM-dependent methyltransferase
MMSPAGNGSAHLAARLADWRSALAAWAIPEHITAAVTDSPWVLPRQVFANRADRVAAEPFGPSYQQEWEALEPPGSVLDIGSGAGAASLPLLPRCTALTAVDVEADMLESLARRVVARGGPPPTLIQGRWPGVAAAAGTADVAACHHVVYNVPDIEPFIAALTVAARRLVVLELTATHPLTSLNPLWLRFHGLVRPDGPTADDLLAILTSMGIKAGYERWARPGGRDYSSVGQLIDVTRRRLCLPPERAGEVAEALADLGIDLDNPPDLGSGGRELVTIWWHGGAAASAG